MAGLFNRIKTWAEREVLRRSDLNSEFDNIINNLNSDKIDDYSTNVTQMRLTENPGASGSESLATSLAGELTRLRYAMNRVIGGTYWYDAPSLSISQINTLIAQGNLTPPPNRIVSGVKRATSNQPNFMIPDGTAATVNLDANPTSFVYRVNGTEYTQSADLTLTGLSLAASSATAAVNDGTLAAAEATKIQGEYDTVITYDTATANFTAGATVGTFQAFKITHSAVDEYFIGFVNSATQITKCFRGFFVNSSGNPIDRIAISDNDVITLMKLHWVFIKTNGTLDSTTNNPTIAFDQPTSPATGDYWFDLNAKIWKEYNGSSFVDATAMLIGLAVCDSSGCKAARSFDFYAAYDEQNSILLEVNGNTQVRSTKPGGKVNVAGNLYLFDKVLVKWNMPDDLVSGFSEASNTTYYLYLKDTGDVAIEPTVPYDRFEDLGGRYHPHHPWRSLGSVLNDGSSNFSTLTQDFSNFANRVASNVSSETSADAIITASSIGTQQSTSTDVAPGVLVFNTERDVYSITVQKSGIYIINYFYKVIESIIGVGSSGGTNLDFFLYKNTNKIYNAAYDNYLELSVSSGTITIVTFIQQETVSFSKVESLSVGDVVKVAMKNRSSGNSHTPWNNQPTFSLLEITKIA